MTDDTKRDYHLRRERQENAAAIAAIMPAIGQLHEAMASHHARQARLPSRTNDGAGYDR